MNNYQRRNEMREEFVEWAIDRILPDIFLTITFAIQLDNRGASRVMSELFWRLSRKSFGQGGVTAGQEIKRIPFIERNAEGKPHYHTLMTLPPRYKQKPEGPDEFKEVVRSILPGLRAETLPNTPRCFRDPFFCDPSDAKWFLYEKKGFSPDDLRALILYGTKTANGREFDCLDEDNVHL